MDGPGSEKTWAFYKVSFERYAKDASISGGPGACSPGKNFKILDARIALVAIFFCL